MRANGSLRAVLGVAVAVLSMAGSAAPMGFDEARHLLARTGFGPTDAEIRGYAALTREQGVNLVLRDIRTQAITPAPAFTLETAVLRYPRADTVTPEERRVFQQQLVRQGLELRAWWMHEMLVTPSPITERMTLFWHNHFVSSQQKVRFSRLMYQQNVTLRANALGSFADLLHAASKDPAMLVYLDTAQSRKAQPNENFAREVMELFTLGEGQYTESDIKEAARAFTGWSLDRETGRYLFRPLIHDAGVKTVLGESGRFDGDAVLDVILERPQTATFITAKLWREFVSENPDPREVERIGKAMRNRNYDIKVALRALLLTDAFWDPANRGTMVKSPVELVVGTLRQLDVAPGGAMPFVVVAAGMGQNLFSPPNVKGWPGGEQWINSNSLLARKQFLDRLARMDDAPSAMMATLPANGDDAARVERFVRAVDRGVRNVQFDAARWVARQPGDSTIAKMQSAQALLLPIPPVVADPPKEDADALAFVRATLLDPSYQLK